MDIEAINLQNQRNSPLLRLPPEVRNRIYTYALSGYSFNVDEHSGNLVFKDVIDNLKYLDDIPYYGPRTLQASCRFVLYETGNMIFTLNTFRLFNCRKDFSTAMPWIHVFKPSNL